MNDQFRNPAVAAVEAERSLRAATARGDERRAGFWEGYILGTQFTVSIGLYGYRKLVERWDPAHQQAWQDALAAARESFESGDVPDTVVV